jgi:hypothetical protein
MLLKSSGVICGAGNEKIQKKLVYAIQNVDVYILAVVTLYL